MRSLSFDAQVAIEIPVTLFSLMANSSLGDLIAFTMWDIIAGVYPTASAKVLWFRF
jgi:hypothetical protein